MLQTKNGKCQYGFDIRTAGGPFITHSSLLTNVGYGAPSQEHMALSECVGHKPIRWTCATVLLMIRLFSEIGLSAWVEDPTTIFSDSVTAIDWAKFGKITPGNNYLALAYHQVREWVENNITNDCLGRKSSDYGKCGKTEAVKKGNKIKRIANFENE